MELSLSMSMDSGIAGNQVQTQKLTTKQRRKLNAMAYEGPEVEMPRSWPAKNLWEDGIELAATNSQLECDHFMAFVRS